MHDFGPIKMPINARLIYGYLNVWPIICLFIAHWTSISASVDFTLKNLSKPIIMK